MAKNIKTLYEQEELMMNEEIPKNMKKCPTCGTLVAKSAKVCPNCGAKLKNKVLLIVIIAVIVFLCICCCGFGVASKNKQDNSTQTGSESSVQTDESNIQSSDTDNSGTPAESNDATPAAPTETTHQIGETFKNGELECTILEYNEQDTFKSNNQFVEDLTSADGTFVVVKVKITNQDSEKRTFDSSMFTLKDSEGRTFDSYNNYNLSFYIEDADSLFLEPCNPGLSKTGYVFFEVPKDLTSYDLAVDSGMLFAGGNTELVHLKG
jgi:hypothetical protein